MKGFVLIALVVLAIASVDARQVERRVVHEPPRRLRVAPARAPTRAQVSVSKGVSPMSSADELEELAEIQKVEKPSYVVGGYGAYASDYPLIQEGSPGPKIGPPPQFDAEVPKPSAVEKRTPGVAMKPHFSQAAHTGHQMPALSEVRMDSETSGSEANTSGSEATPVSADAAGDAATPGEASSDTKTEGTSPVDSHNAGVSAGVAQGKLEGALMKGQQNSEKVQKSLDERLTAVEKELVSVVTESNEVKEAESKDAEASSKAEEASATLEERVEENTKKMNELEGMVKELQLEITGHFNETEAEGGHGDEEDDKESNDGESDGTGNENENKGTETKSNEPARTDAATPAAGGASDSGQKGSPATGSSPASTPASTSNPSSNTSPSQSSGVSGDGGVSESMGGTGDNVDGDGDEGDEGDEGDNATMGGMVDESGDEDISSEPDGVSEGIDGGGDGADGEVASVPSQNPATVPPAGAAAGNTGGPADPPAAKTGNNLKEAVKPKAKIRPSKPAVSARANMAGANVMGMGVGMPMMGSGLNERVGAVGMMGDSISQDSAEMQAGLNALDGMDFVEAGTPAMDVDDTDMTLSGQLYGSE